MKLQILSNIFYDMHFWFGRAWIPDNDELAHLFSLVANDNGMMGAA